VVSSAPKNAARSAVFLVVAYRPHMLPNGSAAWRNRQTVFVPNTTAPWIAPSASDPVHATVRLPGSKSMTARALVLSALAAGPSTLGGPLRARDTELMAGGLRALGTHVSTSDDQCWVVRPHALAGPAHVDVGLAGTVMRFLPPVAALADGPVTFDGDPRARHRPLGPLVDALRAMGTRIDSAERGGLPLTVHGTGAVHGGEVTVDASASSQLVSGLLLAAPAYEHGIVVRHAGPPLPSAPHLRMTVAMLRAAGAAVDDVIRDVWSVAPGRLAGHGWEIEPDLSSAAPFLAAALVTGGEVRIPGWPRATTQPGDRLRELLTTMGGQCTLTTEGLTVRGGGVLHGLTADLSEVSELTMVLAALAALADSPSRLSGIGHIRGHETNRLAALTRELSALGAAVTELEDGIAIEPRPLHPGEFETYDDHRMAHAAAVLGLAVPGVTLSDVACTSKTMPGFQAVWEATVRSGGPARPAGPPAM
jgi:3-phosphoshikimate 1-carboxyvinyltransferase